VFCFAAESVCSAANANCVVYSKLTFTVEVVLSAVNQRSLPKVCYQQRICDSLPKLSVCGELTFIAKIVLATVN